MIVDMSAVISILLDEPDSGRLIDVLTGAGRSRMSAATYVECAVVADRRANPATRARFDRILHELGIDVVPLTVSQAHLAREAYRSFGRGSGHPAGLNFGDCFAYALAAESGDALLFVGDDFGATDVVAAHY